MRHEFTAIYQRDGEWVIATCPEVPGANGQGRTKDEARQSLADAIALILEDRRREGLRGVRAEADREAIVVEVRGAELDTSVSAVVRDYLVEFVGVQTDFEWRRRLQQWALGSIETFRAGGRLTRAVVHDRATSR